MVGDRVKFNWEKCVVCAVCITSGRNASRFSVMYIDGAGVRRYADCTALQGAPKEASAKMCVWGGGGGGATFSDQQVSSQIVPG